MVTSHGPRVSKAEKIGREKTRFDMLFVLKTSNTWNYSRTQEEKSKAKDHATVTVNDAI
jgi:hypothetical protein